MYRIHTGTHNTTLTTSFHPNDCVVSRAWLKQSVSFIMESCILYCCCCCWNLFKASTVGVWAPPRPLVRSQVRKGTHREREREDERRWEKGEKAKQNEATNKRGVGEESGTSHWIVLILHYCSCLSTGKPLAYWRTLRQLWQLSFIYSNEKRPEWKRARILMVPLYVVWKCFYWISVIDWLGLDTRSHVVESSCVLLHVVGEEKAHYYTNNYYSKTSNVECWSKADCTNCCVS